MKDASSEQSSINDSTLPLENLAKQFLQTLLIQAQKKGRDLIMDAIEHGESIKNIYLYVFQPVMNEIGRLWQTGEISVGHEHYCTNAVQVTMAMLYPQLFKGDHNGKRMIAACVQGELHELGLRMVSDFFEMDGWNTCYLGANTPHESVIRMMEDKDIDVLAIGATMHFHLEKVEKMIDSVRQTFVGDKVKILLGGYTFNINQELWRMLGADGFAENAQDAVTLANTLISKRDNNGRE